MSQAFSVKHIDILARDAAKEITVTVKVKGLNELKFRLWIATQIIKFGIWVSGMGCKVEETE